MIHLKPPSSNVRKPLHCVHLIWNRAWRARKTLALVSLLCVVATVAALALIDVALKQYASNSIEDTDAIISLGGDGGNRAEHAITVFLKLRPHALLFTGTDGERFGRAFPYPDSRGNLALASGIEPQYILYDARAMNTWEEAEAIVEAARLNNWKQITVSTNSIHSARVKWALKRASHDDRAIEYRILAADSNAWTPFWWIDRKQRRRTSTEAIKFARYVLIYAYSGGASLRVDETARSRACR
jgi:uncharacterized SAM-binding protein YcdF (DUF218 family)